jgi:hypothetical protein
VWEALEQHWRPQRRERTDASRLSGTLHLAQAQSKTAPAASRRSRSGATAEQLCDAFSTCPTLHPVYHRLLKLALEEPKGTIFALAYFRSVPRLGQAQAIGAITPALRSDLEDSSPAHPL